MALVLVSAAELIGPVRPGRVASVIVLAAGLIVVVANVAFRLDDGYHFLKSQASVVRVDLGVLQALRPRLPADLALSAPVAHDPYLSGITAGRFRAETSAHGVPAFDTPRQILTAPAAARYSADGVLAAAEQLHASPATGASRGRCVAAGTGPAARASVALGPGTYRLTDIGSVPLAVGVRRFADRGALTAIALIRAGATEALVLPGDRLPGRWALAPIAADSASAVALRICPG